MVLSVKMKPPHGRLNGAPAAGVGKEPGNRTIKNFRNFLSGE
jgi:hypothetical protein